MRPTPRTVLAVLTALAVTLPLTGTAPATAQPVKKKLVAAGYSGPVTGGPFINSATVSIGTKNRKAKKKQVVKRVTYLSIGRVYLYCDGDYVEAPSSLDLKGTKVRKKKFTLDQTVTWNNQRFDVEITGRFLGKKAKKAKGTAAITLTDRCGDAGPLTWTATRR